MVKPSSTQGLEVLGVVPDSPAVKAGVMPGDVIVSLDDSSVDTVEDLHQVLLQKTVAAHQAVVKRGAQELELELKISRDD